MVQTKKDIKVCPGGQIPTIDGSEAANCMSALPPKADMCGATRDVCFVPIADIAPPLLDHLMGAGEYRRRHSEAKRFGRFQIEHQLVLGRRLHR